MSKWKNESITQKTVKLIPPEWSCITIHQHVRMLWLFALSSNFRPNAQNSPSCLARSSLCSLSISCNNALSSQTIYREWLTNSCSIKFTYMEGKKNSTEKSTEKKRKTGKTWSSTSTMLSSHARPETGRYGRTLLSQWWLSYFGLSRKTLGGSVIADWHRYKATGELHAD